VVSVATIHHIGTAGALERMQELVRPGGVVAVIGIARSQSLVDYRYEGAGWFATRFHSRTKGYWETSAPKVWPPPEAFHGTRQRAQEVLPGVRYRRHVMFRC